MAGQLPLLSTSWRCWEMENAKCNTDAGGADFRASM
eukprot:CAMPEP_0116958232 /NCGR_PEP_ID=MMETSP0467-20121206/44498_1 /TAXON_ID=283647 /ORGANISM="Mesodinium pulex, Strain SPMC105" /LENGTH=35 /DNA_ID= /DNA_START= /DNA_END= /DNA_ORIENTATION=